MKQTVRHSIFVLVLVLGASLLDSHAAAAVPAAPVAGGSVKSDKPQQFAGISVQVPTGFDKKEETKEKSSSPIPGGPATIETFRSYTNSANQGIFFFHWNGMPMRDRGPMAAAESWESTVDGVNARVSLTTHFFGHAKQVLVAHFTGPAASEHRYMIYTTVIDKAAFAALLSSIRFENRGAAKAAKP